MESGNFDYSTLFNLGTDPKSAIKQGVIALLLNFGNSRNNCLRLATAMRAFRRDVGRYGNRATFENRQVIDSTIGAGLINGISLVFNRFGETAAVRVQIYEAFRDLENDWIADGQNLPPTGDYDADDDPGAGWGIIDPANPPPCKQCDN